jgi:hypothetical protein
MGVLPSPLSWKEVPQVATGHGSSGAEEAPASLNLTPPPLKALTDAIRSWGTMFLLIGLVACYFLGRERGQVVGWIIGAALVACWLAYQLVRFGSSRVDRAIEVLTAPDRVLVERRRAAAEDLRVVRRIGTLAFVILAGAAVGAGAFAGWGPADRWLNTSTPDRIDFADIHYFQAKDSASPTQAPFLDAVITALQEEGKAERKPYRPLVGRTAPLGHPTPAFRCSLHVDRAGFEWTGYAFRLHQDGSRVSYEPIPAEYTETSVVFVVPPCERGDRLYIVGRLIAPSEEFPTDLKPITSLRLAHAEERR